MPDTSTLSPANNKIIPPANNTLSLNFTREIQRPSVSSYIRFHSATNDAVVHTIDTSYSSEVEFSGSKLLITPSYTFPEDQYFYITFQTGIVKGFEGCDPASEAVTSKTFWKFQIASTSEPVTTSSVYPASGVDYYYHSTVDLVCHSSGEPVPVVTWYKDGTLLGFANDVSISQTTNGHNVTSVLTISALMTSHEGKYTCNGTNTLSNGTITTDVESIDVSVQGSK